jgi:hypothetical protein
MTQESKYIATISPDAFDRCFLVGEILSEVYGQHYIEYGLLALAAESSPLHIISTPLLWQYVTWGSVYQPSSELWALQREVEILSKRFGQSLSPIGLVHRHPGLCYLSSVDEDFLTGTMLDQVAATTTFQKICQIRPRDFPCRCFRTARKDKHNVRYSKLAKTFKVEYSLCFSIVVNCDPSFEIFAALKQWCPFCEMPSVKIVPAALRIEPKRQLTKLERSKLKSQLEVEVEAKIKFGTKPIEQGGKLP